MVEHTPGPWKQNGLSIMAHGRGVVAKCPTPQNGGCFDCQANARLIAAAPELLKQLSEMVDAVAKGAVELNSAEIDVGDPDIPPHPWHEAWLHNARAVLAKATKGQDDD